MSKTNLPWDWYFDHQHPFAPFAERETFATREERDQALAECHLLTTHQIVRFNEGLRYYDFSTTSLETFNAALKEKIPA